MSILLDTGFLFAFLHADDVRHDAAVAAMKEVALGRYGACHVPDAVIHELLTLIRVRTRDARLEDAAAALLPPEPALPGLRVTATHPLLAATWRLFIKYRGLSFTDASLLATLDSHGIEHLATFDGRLRGLASVLP